MDIQAELYIISKKLKQLRQRIEEQRKEAQKSEEQGIEEQRKEAQKNEEQGLEELRREEQECGMDEYN